MRQFKRNLKYADRLLGHKKLKYVCSRFNMLLEFSKYNSYRKNRTAKRVFIYKCMNCNKHLIIAKHAGKKINSITMWHWEDSFLVEPLLKMLTCNEIIIKDIIE